MKLDSVLWLIVLAIFLPAVCFFFTIKSASEPPVFNAFKYETPCLWLAKTDKRPTPEEIKTLDDEIADIIRKEAPLTHIQDPVLSLGPTSYRLTYLSDTKMSDTLSKTINDHIEERFMEFARAQGSTQ